MNIMISRNMHQAPAAQVALVFFLFNVVRYSLFLVDINHGHFKYINNTVYHTNNSFNLHETDNSKIGFCVSSSLLTYSPTAP